MNIEGALNWFFSQSIIQFFFKPFALVFGFLYLLYSVVVLKQTQVMLKTIDGKNYGIILVISFAQVLLALLVLFLAFAI